MFRWYSKAKICYAYLSDVETDNAPLVTSPLTDKGRKQFRESRWFTRGWTLQELIAPPELLFYGRRWQCLGEESALIDTLSEITHIDEEVLKDRKQLPRASFAKRMSWASTRSTSREEDETYSLLGIFDVNMPLLYGEGGSKAFRRLQEEFIRTSTTVDHSLLAWMPWQGAPDCLLSYEDSRPRSELSAYQTLLSPSPYGFRHAQDIVSWDSLQSEAFELLHRELRISLPAKDISRDVRVELWQFIPKGVGGIQDKALIVALNCGYADEPMTRITLLLKERPHIYTLEEINQGCNYHEDRVYDRLHSPESCGRFSSISKMSRLAGSFTRRVLTVGKAPFIWPVFGNKVQVVLDPESCVVAE